jgi:hypothetical protein
MMTIINLPTSLLKYFHGAAIDMVNSDSVNKCQVAKQRTTFQDSAHIIFQFVKYLVVQNMQPFLQVSSE